MSRNDGIRIAFIVSKFPCYDEAFILREIYALSKEMDIKIFSLKKSKDKVIHGEAAELKPKTIYVPFFFSWEIIAAQCRIFFKYPRRYTAAFFENIFGNLKSPEFLLKNLAFFPKAIYLANWLIKNKIDHMHAY